MATTEIQTLITAVAAAVADADYETAKNKLLQAEILFAAVPLEAGKGGSAGTMMKWREQLETLHNRINSMQREQTNASAPLIQSVPLQYAEPRGVAPL